MVMLIVIPSVVLLLKEFSMSQEGSRSEMQPAVPDD
jgi:hypothetical protein